MNKRSKLAALLGAGLLTFGVASMALATTGTDLLVGQVGSKMSDFTNNCDFGDAVDGMVGVQFNLTSAESNDGTLDATFSNPASTPHKASVDKADGGTIKWYVWITGTADTVIESAHTDVVGNNLVISHVCIGAPAPTPTPTPTPTLPGGGGAGDTNQPPTNSIGSTGTSGPSDTAWLLVVGLGVLLASIVVLTPARAKNRR